MEQLTFEKIKEEIAQLAELYKILTSKPEPEEEEDAHTKMIPLMERIIDCSGEHPDILKIASDLQKIIVNWDPLENWFFEVKSLKEKMGEFLLKIDPDQKEIQAIIENSNKLPESKNESIEKSNSKSKISSIINIRDFQEFDQDSDFINLEKQSKIDNRLQDIEKRMQKMMRKDKPVIPNTVDSELKSNNSKIFKTKLEPPSIKPKLEAPKITIPNVPEPKKRVTPSNNSLLLRNHSTPIKISPDYEKINHSVSSISTNIDLETKLELENTEDESTNISQQILPNTSQSYVERSKKQNKLKILNISTKSKIIRPENETSESEINEDFQNVEKVTNEVEKQRIYQKMMEFEAKKYHIEAQINELDKSFSDGMISQDKYQLDRSTFNSELINYSTQITNIRSRLNI